MLVDIYFVWYAANCMLTDPQPLCSDTEIQKEVAFCSQPLVVCSERANCSASALSNETADWLMNSPWSHPVLASKLK